MTEEEKVPLKASEFHLSWNNYEASLASFLRVLSDEEALCDVTISCSGGKLFQVRSRDCLLFITRGNNFDNNHNREIRTRI